MSEDGVKRIIASAMSEDLGGGGVTTAATVPADARARAVITQKAPGVVFSLDVAELVFRDLDPEVTVRRLGPEGVWRESGPVLEIEGQTRAVPSGERTALNLLQRRSGVATQAARYARAVEGTGARILDTRKTTPGMRRLEKQAVAAGGALNDRAGLYDAILIKENHATMAGGVGTAVRREREAAPELPPEVECRDLAEVEDPLAASAPRILLDKMTPRSEAVELVAGRAELEASGGIDLETVREAATTGVDSVWVGALTHSAPALDLSLILEVLP